MTANDDETTHVPCPLCDVGHVHPDLAVDYARKTMIGEAIKKSIPAVLVLVVLGWVVFAGLHQCMRTP
ncbi:MAG TPA: hypothetical protein VFN70_18125 [Burkholderiales bacterium]|nr:hypothetical protein [Burkholderiales bacterium]